MREIVSREEWDQVKYFADLIIDNLDALALGEVLDGSGGDLDNLITILYEEIHRTIHYQDPSAALINPGSFGYLEKFTATTIETLRCSNLSYFILDCLPEFHMNWHHIEWCNMLQIYRLLCVIAARDHSKSYLFSFAHTLWHLYRYKKPIPGQRNSLDLALSKEVLLFTHEYKLAKIHLGKVKEEIESN
ncbi:MAG: hypothetical protein JHC54_08930, partial [Acinetobacter sp.]|nr:hypothetical protein [Acinetobacter sp.]